MDQIKERCIYCGSDVYYTGTEVLIKCGRCGHTLVVAKFENELARMNQTIEEGEQAKKDLAEAEKARQDAEVRLQEAVESLSGIKDGQDVLSQLMKSVMVGQDTAEGKLAQVQSVSERILKNQGNLFEGMHILDEIKDHLQLIGMDAKASQDYAMSFMTWFQNIHEGDKARLENAAKQSSELLVEQKKINEKIDLLHQSAEKTQKTLDDFHSQWKESQLEELRQLYHQAENYQHDRVYDKAYDKYEQIVTKGGGDCEVIWRMILCHYCVSYQQSDDNGKLIPIILNPDLTVPEEMSLRKDLAVQMKAAPSEQKAVYEEELAKIDRILNKYRLIRGNVSYDVFISVKQQINGNPTKDSFVAVMLYNILTGKGLKVFNSRLTPPPAGQEYEPYIISALMSAKAMIVVGTSRENMQAQWVKNEWSRFQWLQKSEKKKTGKSDRVLLCYLAEGMKPESIPRGLSPDRQAIMDGITADKQLDQALDFILSEKRKAKKTEAIKGMSSADRDASQMMREPIAGNLGKANTEPLLRRAFIFLEDGEWNKADDFCEQVLNLDPENAQAYLGKLMADLHVHKKEELPNCALPFDKNNNFKKVVRFGGDELSVELNTYIAHINTRNENKRLTDIYNQAVKAMNSAKTQTDFKAAASTFKTISGFKDADSLYEQCLEHAETCRKDALYILGRSQMTGEEVYKYQKAISIFQVIPGWKDADEQVGVCQRKIEEIKAREEAERIEQERQKEQERIEQERKKEQERVEAEKEKKKRIKIIKISMRAIIACGAFVALLFTVISPKVNHNKAKQEYQNDILTKSQVGDYVVFGSYEQDNDTSNGKEDIEWLVLAREGDRVLVISRYGLDCQKFNSSDEGVTWETCSLRAWLNENFISSAFSPNEQAMIESTTVTAYNNPRYSTSPGNDTKDKVFLLSITEANAYFDSNKERRCQSTEYCKARGAFTSPNSDYCWWWLRTPGDHNQVAAYVVEGVITERGTNICSEKNAIRPALWINVGS